MTAQSAGEARGRAEDRSEPHTEFPTVFSPLRIGPMRLRNCIIVPTHAMADGNLLGSDAEAERFIAYYRAKAEGGAALVSGSSMHLRTYVPAGFEPSGMGAFAEGHFRHPLFVERAARFVESIHSAGARASMQIIFMGGTPHGPSESAHGFFNNRAAHRLTGSELDRIVAEYAFSAGRLHAVGVDAIELHGNNDDLLQWFMSPLTNDRTDRYGGSPVRRLTLVSDVLRAIRGGVGAEVALGVRVCMDELIPGGYGVEEARAACAHLSDERLVDYLHLNVGNNWGQTSYLPAADLDTDAWAATAGLIRASASCPIVYTGRVTHPAQAERILAAGQADAIGVVRASIADPAFALKAATGRSDEIRPCVGGNDCLNRVTIDGVAFSCSVNPRVGSELIPVAPVDVSRRIVVVGGGPAGLEAAATAAERGHDVTLWEARPRLGGQLVAAARMPHQATFAQYIDFQEARARRAGVRIELERTATAADVLAAGADVVVVATGASPRRPGVPGASLPHVVDAESVLGDGAEVGERVVLVIEDDHLAPLGTADFLIARGHRLTLVYRTPEIAPLVGRYGIGAPLARLFAGGVSLVPMHRLVAVEERRVQLADVYGGTPMVLDDVDTVVLACGGQARSELHTALAAGRPHRSDLHLIGDAYAPRRLTYATRQGDAVGRLI